MKLSFLFVVLLTISLPACGQSAKGSLEGCEDPAVVSVALANLHRYNWQSVSLDQLRSIWPVDIDGQECDPGGCRSVWCKDRIISGHCQCCASFSFRIQGTKDKPRTVWLDNMVINYSSSGRAEVVAAAKMFARALGLGTSELETVGRDSVQSFDWKTNGKAGYEVSAIGLQFIDAGTHWELRLSSSQNIPE